MINGTVGELEEIRAMLSFEPDWILIDDIVQLRESLQVIAFEAGTSSSNLNYLP